MRFMFKSMKTGSIIEADNQGIRGDLNNGNISLQFDIVWAEAESLAIQLMERIDRHPPEGYQRYFSAPPVDNDAGVVPRYGNN